MTQIYVVQESYPHEGAQVLAAFLNLEEAKEFALKYRKREGYTDSLIEVLALTDGVPFSPLENLAVFKC